MRDNVTLHRLPDGLPVPVFNLSLSLDAASWTWGFEALLPAVAESLVAPGSNGGPVELVASVNGTAFRVLAESISRERVFGDASIRISGRGRNAVLAAPYAPVMNFQQPQARTARDAERPGHLRADRLTVLGGEFQAAFLRIQVEIESGQERKPEQSVDVVGQTIDHRRLHTVCDSALERERVEPGETRQSGTVGRADPDRGTCGSCDPGLLGELSADRD